MRKGTIYCDRCGKEIKADWWDNHGFHLHKRKFILERISQDGYVDLCPSCYNSLRDWFKKGMENKE